MTEKALPTTYPQIIHRLSFTYILWRHDFARLYFLQPFKAKGSC